MAVGTEALSCLRTLAVLEWHPLPLCVKGKLRLRPSVRVTEQYRRAWTIEFSLLSPTWLP